MELIFQPQIQLTQLFLIERDSALICSHAQTKEFSFVICHGHIFQNGHIRTSAHCRVLVYPSDSAQTTVFFFFGNILPFNEYLPAVRVDTPAYDVQHRSFSGTIAPHYGYKLPFFNRKIKILEQAHFIYRTRIIIFMNMLKFKHFFLLSDLLPYLWLSVFFPY